MDASDTGERTAGITDARLDLQVREPVRLRDGDQAVLALADEARALGHDEHVPADLAAQVRTVYYETSGRTKDEANPRLNDPQPNSAYVVDGRHLFVTDADANTVHVQSRLEPGERSRGRDDVQGEVGRSGLPLVHSRTFSRDPSGRVVSEPAPAGGKTVNDHGMHLVPSSRGGPKERINIVPGAGTVNLTNDGFRQHEGELGAAARAGHTSQFRLSISYPESARRATESAGAARASADSRPTAFRGGHRTTGSARTEPIDIYNAKHSRLGR